MIHPTQHTPPSKKPKKENILKLFGREPVTLDELARCVIRVIESQPTHTFPRSSKYERVKVAGFAWKIRYNDHIRNSHYSPEGCEPNWQADNRLPTGYPGFFGRVWVRYVNEIEWASGVFDATLTHPGTGGSGAYDGPWADISHHEWRFGVLSGQGRRRIGPVNLYPVHCFSWDYRFFLLDWPEISNRVSEKLLIEKLSDRKWDSTHRFEWTDPDIIAADKKFILDHPIPK